jgi:hypothetical protein
VKVNAETNRICDLRKYVILDQIMDIEYEIEFICEIEVTIDNSRRSLASATLPNFENKKMTFAQVQASLAKYGNAIIIEV